MKDWAVSFIAAVLLIGLVIWCAYVVIPLLR
jgi:succinate dehydrogenase hydrophobic anchor subunit